jgi:hypothetical protein
MVTPLEQHMDDEISSEDFNELDDADVRELLADEARDDLAIVPVRCIVNGHEFEMYRGLTYCQKCGQDQYDEIAPSGMRL